MTDLDFTRRGFFWALSAFFLAVTAATFEGGSELSFNVQAILGGMTICILGVFYCFFRAAKRKG